CVEGTDCTDCGGVDAIVDYSKPLDPSSGAVSCTNTCIYPRAAVDYGASLLTNIKCAILFCDALSRYSSLPVKSAEEFVGLPPTIGW
ncbi:hypothetical protein M1146_05015, partial [Patescibacteria group bacterium]|nr:hypothetical protein [Patescibacteria group bacterium]